MPRSPRLYLVKAFALSSILSADPTPGARAGSYGSPSGSCADGLQDPPVAGGSPGGPPGRSGQSATSSGTRYSVLSGATPLPVPCTPTAMAAGNVVTITLTGTTPYNGGDNILSGPRAAHHHRQKFPRHRERPVSRVRQRPGGIGYLIPLRVDVRDQLPGFLQPRQPSVQRVHPLPGTEAYKANLTDQFEDYLLYQPPGSTQYVPLGHFVWTTDGHATEPLTDGGYDWSYWTSAQPAGTVTPSGSATRFLPNNSFPMWTQNSGNDDGSYWTNP